MARRIITSLLKQLREKLNGVRERELAVALKRMPDLTPAQRESIYEIVQAHSNSIARAYKAGVRIAMGTDEGVMPHGHSLEEMARQKASLARACEKALLQLIKGAGRRPSSLH